jgi:hypothetical protein
LTFGALGRGTWCFSGSDVSTTPSHRPRDDVVATASQLEVVVVQQQLHLLCTPMRVHSHRRGCAPVGAQPWWNEQALPVERLDKFYPSGDISGFVPIYVTQGFRTLDRACLPCSPVGIVSRNRSGATKPRCGLNELHSSVAILAHRRWVVVSIYGLSSSM